MGFFDDPMLASLAMGNMGMGGAAASTGNPFGNVPTAQSSPMHTMMQMRAMRYMREPIAPSRPMRMPGQGRGPGLYGQSGLEGSPMDYSQFTYNPAANAAAKDFLGQYGLGPLAPNQVQNNTILPNSGFFGRHPMFSGALEGGIYGAAAGRGADTWGEGISNIAQSMMTGPQMQRAAWERQFAAPFQAGNMFEQMQDMAQKRELQGMDIELRRAQIEKMKNTPDPKTFRSFGVSANDANVATVDETTGKVTLTPVPDYNPDRAARASGQGSDTFKAFTARYGPEPADGGPKDMHGLTARQRWGSQFASFQVSQSVGKGTETHSINRGTDEPVNIANKNLDEARNETKSEVERMRSEKNIKQVASGLAQAGNYSQPRSVYEDQARQQVEKQVAALKAKFQSDYPAAGLTPMPGGASGSWTEGPDKGTVKVRERTWNPTSGKLE